MTAVITCSEVITAEQLRFMRDVFGGPVVDHYAQTERVAMAGNCEAGGYYEFPDSGIIELIPVGGRTDHWEIVGTPLKPGVSVVPVSDRVTRSGPARSGQIPADERSGSSERFTDGSRTRSSPRTDRYYRFPTLWS